MDEQTFRAEAERAGKPLDVAARGSPNWVGVSKSAGLLVIGWMDGGGFFKAPSFRSLVTYKIGDITNLSSHWSSVGFAVTYRIELAFTENREQLLLFGPNKRGRDAVYAALNETLDAMGM